MDEIFRELRQYDVSPARATRLRDRCHRLLQEQRGSSDERRDGTPHRPQRAVRMLVGAWCSVYLFETIRRAVSVYW
jgi:hypothetical protein